ncbi:hypothetical protein HYV98_01940, partial [Candidatus Azambacteria bacterium]|nr:hypothetical protein [Candidatus Azambacteria bacterium]
SKKFTWWKALTLHLPNLPIIFATLTPGVLIAGLRIQPWGPESILGIGYPLFGLYFALYTGWAFLILLFKHKRADGILRRQLTYILIGLVISITFGVIFNLIFILGGNYRFIWVGPYASFIMLSFIGFAILKHHLFNIKVIATEILTASILIILFGQIFVAKTTNERLLRTFLFGLTAIFGYLLIRSVLAEVRQREELQKLTLALETANEDLQRLDKARREFVSIASHQLRTPLSAIKGFVSMILEGSFGKVAAKTRDALGKVYQSNERLVKLVNDLLDLSRIEAGRMQYEFQVVKFDEMVDSVVDELKIKANEKKLRLTYTGPSEPLPPLSADPTKLRQVVMNLIDNAIKYTPEGSVTVTLKKRSGDEARLEVADTGVGLEPEEKEHLFHMFHRGPGGHMFHTEGTGLGLYIAKKIIEDHKGRIEVSSPGKGKGSRFSLILPIQQ